MNPRCRSTPMSTRHSKRTVARLGLRELCQCSKATASGLLPRPLDHRFARRKQQTVQWLPLVGGLVERNPASLSPSKKTAVLGRSAEGRESRPERHQFTVDFHHPFEMRAGIAESGRVQPSLAHEPAQTWGFIYTAWPQYGPWSGVVPSPGDVARTSCVGSSCER